MSETLFRKGTPGGRARLRDNIAELVALVDECGELLLREELSFDDHEQPDARLAKFFKDDAELVDEIAVALGRAGFVIIGGW